MLAYRNVALPDDRSIRLLSLEPGEGEAPLRRQLITINIEDATDYEPVSYAWGDPTRTERIICSDHELRITSSVHSALMRLKFLNAQRSPWVDQICIDQQNLDERSRQVKFMSRIYENAAHVLVWLGRDEEHIAEKAFQFIQKLVDTFGNDSQRDIFRTNYIDSLDEHSCDEWSPLKAMTNLSWVSSVPIVFVFDGTALPSISNQSMIARSSHGHG